MTLSKQSNKLINIAIYSLFIAVLFKPGEKSQGMYEWMVRPQYVINILKVIFILAFGTFLIYSIVYMVKNIKTLFKVIPKDYFFLISFLILSTVWTQFISFYLDGESFSQFIFRVILYIYFAMFFFQYIKIDMKLISYLLPIAISSGIFVLFNMALLIYDPNAVWPASSFARMYGITEHPNFFAIICAIAFISNLEIFKNYNDLEIKHYKILIRFYFFSSTILAFLGITFSGSRTGLIFILLYLFLGYFLRKRITYLRVFLYMFLLILLFLFGNNLDIFLNIEGSRMTSTENNRSDAWIAMWNIFYNNSLYGIGLHNVHYSENAYLRTLAGSGIVGFTFFIIPIVMVLFKAFRNLKYKVLSAFSLLIISLLVTSMSEGFLLDSLTFPILIFLYSITLIFNKKEYL